MDPGELAAIQLALTEPDSLLLIDEAAGRAAASRLGIPNTGTLGVLLAAGQLGVIDVAQALTKLQGTNFRISHKLIQNLLAELGGSK